ncbi:MAG: nicotinate-nucleotide diphosphorylase (carboxylating) [Elusimicrobia bacterium RIFCSPLOWO2_01_FULL_59_12]|nr:MAG: nicotinate-nucleotide diphosphorylase (carboxylating) [Elusimicrobia bacterium RIFCSPLOWO2_01_FULL_59_12]
MHWNSPAIHSLIHLALEEDAANHDITTRTLIPAHLRIEAQIRAKGHGVVCGIHVAEACFKQLDSHCIFSQHLPEGRQVKPGTVLATIRGKARAILSAERTALNALQHLSGIATFTRTQVRRLHSKRTAIYDTRKTLPGWRELQKHAVRCGGGKNHRMSLRTYVLIKDNHLRICRLINKDWIQAMKRLRRRHPSLPVEMEIQTNRDVKDALRLAPHQVLLDNMRPTSLRALIKKLRLRLPHAEIEISGGVRPEQLQHLRRLGVERISMGRLTHSAPAFDCTLDITRVFNAR